MRTVYNYSLKVEAASYSRTGGLRINDVEKVEMPGRLRASV